MRKPYFTVIIYVMTFVLFCAIASYSFFDETQASDRENRSLTPLPALTTGDWLSGEFATRLDGFFSDHVFARDTLIGFGRSLEKQFRRSGGVNLVTGSVDRAADPAGADPADTTDYLLLEDRILQVFRYDPGLCDQYTATVNDIFGMFPADTGRYLMVAPNRIAFEASEYAQHSSPQEPAIEQVYANVGPGVEAIDAYGALERQKGQLENLYFRLDRHWTHAGAYFAAQAMWEQLDREYIPIELYERYEAEPFLGYLYAVTGRDDYAEQYDEFVYYLYEEDAGRVAIQKTTETDAESERITTESSGKTIDPERQGYYSFLSEIYSCAVLEGEAEDGSGLLIVGDSYANALAPWMAANYETVVVIDPRFYLEGKEGIMELTREYGLNDVLVVNYTITMSSPYFMSYMEALTE